MTRFHLEIATPDGRIFDNEVESLLVRTDDGDVEILAGHADFLASLSTGRARLITESCTRFASVSGGFVSVISGKVKVCAITFEFSDKINVKRAEEAKARAEAAINSSVDEKAVRIAKAKLARAMNRINVAGIK